MRSNWMSRLVEIYVMHKPMICLIGPTASGKTALACEWVQRWPCEIISIDSALIYREMNIGTAKPDAATLAMAPHHLIDICDPIDSYSAAQCYDDVQALCADIHARRRVPLLVGGTMMYFQALQQGLSALPAADASLRRHLLTLSEEHGWHWMHAWLARVDPITATRLHPHDTQRIQRALEVYELTQKPLSRCLQEQQKPLEGTFINWGLMPDSRAWLHERIAQRFQHMVQVGMIEEVQQLLQRWPLTLSHPAMRCVGYRQVLEYLQGVSSREQVIDKGIAATRQLAKRQMTWLRNSLNATLFAPDDPTTPRKMMVELQKIIDNLSF